MVTASLVVSLVAILVAIASTAFTWQQTRIARDRQHDEKTPKFTADIETMNPHSDAHWYRMRLRLESLWPLDAIGVLIAEGKGVHFTRSQKGVDPSASFPIPTASHGLLQHGELTIWRVELEQERDPKIQVRVTCRSGKDEPWTVPLLVKVPVTPDILL
jgi:hypothetical protein